MVGSSEGNELENDDESEDDEPESDDAMAWLIRYAEVARNEPVVHTTRQITITQEMLETAYVWDILDPVSCKMLGAGTGAEAEAVLASFSLGQRRLYGVEKYLTEVCHGGHEYFYRYSGALVWPDALAGLNMLGASAARDILLESTQQFPEPPSVEFDAREKALDKLPTGAFYELDGRLFKVDDQVRALMRTYSRAHPDEFLWSGTVEEIEHPYKLEVINGEPTWVLKASE
jgi:hypothetical protein